MISVNSTIKINLGAFKRIDAKATAALEQTAEALHTDVVQAQVMPRDQGTLQNEATFVDTTESDKGKVSLVSSTPYARRLYFHPEYHFDQTKNPNAGGEWLKDWLPGGSKEDFVQKTFTELYRRNSGS